MQDANIIYSLPSWGSSILTFTLALALLTQAIKGRLKRHLEQVPAYLIQVSTLVLGIALAALIHSQGLLVDPLFASVPAPYNWLLFGGIAGVGAIGGYDLIIQIARTAGGKKAGTLPANLPTAEQAEQQLDTAPRLALDTLRRLAAGFGIPAVITETILSDYTLAEAEKLIRSIGAKRALTPDEIQTNMSEWQRQQASRVTVVPDA